MEFKYLILRDRLDVEYPVLWPKPMDSTDPRSGVSHREMARIHSASAIRVVSAGFCVVVPHCPAQAFGKSESLGMESREEDAGIIGQHFRWQ